MCSRVCSCASGSDDCRSSVCCTLALTDGLTGLNDDKWVYCAELSAVLAMQKGVKIDLSEGDHVALCKSLLALKEMETLNSLIRFYLQRSYRLGDLLPSIAYALKGVDTAADECLTELATYRPAKKPRAKK